VPLECCFQIQHQEHLWPHQGEELPGSSEWPLKLQCAASALPIAGFHAHQPLAETNFTEDMAFTNLTDRGLNKLG